MIHETCCKHCPSKQGTDPEVQDVLTWPREQQLETLFVCAWRPDKLCRGYCETLNVTQKELETHQ